MKKNIKVEFPGFIELFDRLLADQKNNKKEIVTKKELFVQFILLSQKTMLKNSELNKKFKIDLFDFTEDYDYCIDILLKLFFSEEDKDWIDWWLYERVGHSGEINKAYYKNGKEIILYTPEDLWDFLNENNKKKK